MYSPYIFVVCAMCVISKYFIIICDGDCFTSLRRHARFQSLVLQSLRRLLSVLPAVRSSQVISFILVRLEIWSGAWDSNPPLQLGRLRHKPLYQHRIFYYNIYSINVNTYFAISHYNLDFLGRVIVDEYIALPQQKKHEEHQLHLHLLLDQTLS